MDSPPSKTGLLHLQPRSRATQRIWLVGETNSTAPAELSGELCLAALPDEHENFASLKTIIAQLAPFAQGEQRAMLTRLEGYLREACPEPVSNSDPDHGGLLADSVAFAIMRRISRESVYTARVIDLSAQLINAILSQLPYTHVRINHIDRLDRPTIKVLTRAMLLLEPASGFSWVWHSTSDPLVTTSVAETDDMFLASRSSLLRQLVGILSPTVQRYSRVTPLVRPKGQGRSKSIYDISAALVMQNYDACFLWCDTLLGSVSDREVAEGLRLLALAAANIGKFEEALRALSVAEKLPVGSGRGAHLCYLQGLIEAKRRYDLSSSTAHYERGLAALDGSDREVGDLPLEHGWLLNGLALNEAILWRRNPSATEHYTQAFRLVRNAFELVRTGNDPARTYLRFNLLANSAFLLEMQGKNDLAIDVLRETFDFPVDDAPGKKHRWRSTIGYRIGVLHYRAGRLEESYRLLQEAAEEDALTDSWATQERILRALGRVALDRHACADAAAIFATGLDICRRSRVAEGTREHGLGLIAALLQDGQERRAWDVNSTLRTEEGLAVVPGDDHSLSRQSTDLRPSPPSPKLPAYIPEIDLEGIPIIDLNRFLGSATSQNFPAVVSWKG